MDLEKVLAQLREELNNIDTAIVSLERLQREGRRRGRPPKAIAEIRNNIKVATPSVSARPKPGRESKD